MARADLLVNLVKAGIAGDTQGARSVAEAIIAEERGKQHTVLAERLDQVVRHGMRQRSPSQTAERHPAKELLYDLVPERRMEDLVLPATVQRACRQLIAEQQKASTLRAQGLSPRHRVLLVGPPGNGKTSLAETLAEALAVPFLVVRYDAIVASYLGETATRLRRVFEYARTIPCVLFFDEFDAVGKERGDTHETGEIKRVVASLLMQMDDLPSNTVVVAASNHPELLDRATWRRFQIRVTLPAPTSAALEAYLARFLASLSGPAGISARMLVKKIGLISYAEAEEFCLDVRRQLALGGDKATAKSVIADVIPIWRERQQAIEGQG
jgi:SpoVK/Ycf46/Vps4 family AAA+-type ATPase